MSVHEKYAICLTKKFDCMKKFFLTLVAVFTAISMFGQNRLSIYFADETGSPVQRQVTATLGETFNAPYLVFEPAEAQRSVRVEYGSSNPDAAEIDMTSGCITLKAAGSTYITATTGQTEQYYSATARYQLVVEAAQDTTPVVPPTCPEARWNLPADNVLKLHVGDVVSVPELMGGAGSILYLNMKYIDNIRVAELTESDMIWARGVGTTTFTGTIMQGGADGSGQTLQCDYTFTIVVEDAAPQKQKPGLSFDINEVDIELGEAFVAPQIVNPNNITLTPANSKWYNRWDSKVATVNEATGELTILGVGVDTIYFEFTGNDTYEGDVISYEIRVTTFGLNVGGINVTSKNASDVLGDNGSITYDPITHTLTMTNAILSANLNLAPALKRATKEEMMASAILYTKKETLTIILNGGNSILGSDAGIYAEWAPVLMKGGENGGSIRISANIVGVKAEAYKIYECSVTATGSAAAVAVNMLGVATGGWLMAQGQGLAIQANHLVMAEGGEGIGILTEGVYFEENKGFFTQNKEYAKIVEIGKVVVVPPADEVTTIDFSTTDPEGNETVVFSTSATDTYNETTGQLEITTQLTDAQVETALATLVPGSSEWIEMLPGSLVFDIPAGEGKVRVQCKTLQGYKLQVKIEGKAAVSVTQTELGWAEVSYNVAEPLHVVIYLHAPNASAPARIAMRTQDNEAHAFIQAVEIQPKNAPTAIEQVEMNKLENGAKMLIEGRLYILRDGRIFNANGIQVR